MRVGIVGLTNGTNYGNKLQNYAIIEIFNRLGYKAETIRNTRNSFDQRKYSYRIKRVLKLVLKKNVQPIDIRRMNFDRFSKKYLNEAAFIISDTNKPDKLNQLYDVFFAGSDQVWNPTYEFNSDIEFMPFADKKKRNSFAASFGVDNLTEMQKEYFRPLLLQMNHISVREERGADFVEELTGNRPLVSIDPTMMLDADDYKKISKKPKWVESQKYMVTYFLGGKSDKLNQSIEKLAKEKGFSVINLSGESKDDTVNLQEYCADPGEFVWLIANSELVLTDSFHAVVFSILHEKPFCVFDRNDENGDDVSKTNSRVGTLLARFHLIDHKKNIDINQIDILPIDNFYVKKVLSEERQKTYGFIKNAMSDVE